ncbi:flagellin [Pseudorhodoferax soli]|uniref:Flagellin n=1 Tax=Pseudorhodoferax soli TaxID=545864 RepID=A0A368XRD9_9BURK|nr:flagellin [Pseudorhodoferax soli]RCW70512.1 flagellin [Pseudorhodoferax soli]
MLSLHTNTASLSGQNALTSTNKALSTSLTRLSTGYRVNSAMDDAAGLQIATRLNAQTRGMAVAQRNTQNGISMMQTAEGAFAEVTNILLRQKDLLTEGATASTTQEDRVALQAEYDALGLELSNIIRNTSFGGTELFSDGSSVTGTGGLLSSTALTFQIGASSGETMAVNTQADLTALTTALAAVSSNFTTAAAGAELGTTTTTVANGNLADLDAALTAVGKFRSTLGAASNRLEHVFNNLGNMSLNTQAASGRIMDVDYASESANMTTKQMLMQAGTSMLKQSNSMSQLALSLLQ